MKVVSGNDGICLLTLMLHSGLFCDTQRYYFLPIRYTATANKMPDHTHYCFHAFHYSTKINKIFINIIKIIHIINLSKIFILFLRLLVT
ncbi:hypothetical protein PUN28_007961 [Cardiocondyla obscurior]|uniref:Secreted protein n=1 Tax=Cardiocondyla obscurior TaxID=286306 RepID=A0AAW2FWX7_9HYME